MQRVPNPVVSLSLSVAFSVSHCPSFALSLPPLSAFCLPCLVGFPVHPCISPSLCVCEAFFSLLRDCPHLLLLTVSLFSLPVLFFTTLRLAVPDLRALPGPQWRLRLQAQGKGWPPGGARGRTRGVCLGSGRRQAGRR